MAIARRLSLFLATFAAFTGSAYANEQSDLRGRAHIDEGRPCAAEESECAVLLGVTIDGASVISPAELAPLYEPLLTHPVRIDDLAALAQAITARYHAEGYFLSRAVIPPQDWESGVAHIEVVEGRINDVAVEGEGANAVAPALRRLATDGPARLETIDRQLALAGDVPGLTLRPRIEPDPDDLGAHRLVVETERKAWSGYVSLDNRGTEEAGPLQLYAHAAANSVGRDGDQLALATLLTPANVNELAFGELSYLYPLAHGARLSASVSAYELADGADITSSRIGGDGAGVVIGYQAPLYRRRHAGVWLGAAFEAHHVRHDWSTGGGYADELRVAQVFLRGFIGEDGRATTFFLQPSFGLDVLGASDASPTRRSRAFADGQFAKLNLHVSHYRDLGRFFGAYVAFDAQTADGPLLRSEEFAIGGLPYGRAYNYGEITGDRALAGLVELRAGFAPPSALVSFAQTYLFFDAGTVLNVNETGADEDASLSSAGGGVRITLLDRLTARAELARPLSLTPAEEQDRDWRPFFSLSAAY